jgi:FkbM family methyltransferase
VSKRHPKKDADRKARKKAKKAAKAALMALPAPPSTARDLSIMADAGEDSPTHQHLARARARWEHGDWEGLLALDPSEVAGDPDRARLALILSAAHSHAGDMDRARELARQGLVWGATREMAARVLLSAAQNSAARVAAALEEDPTPQFEAAIHLVQPHADAPLLARSRRVRELSRMGLLPDAAAVLEQELGLIRGENEDRPELAILESKIRILKHELSQALLRGQLHAAQFVGESFESVSRESLAPASVSQLGQDLWVLERSNYKRGGFFVEFGATDGVILSNTYLLEKKFGWNGLCAEPNPDYFVDLKRNRNCRVSNACIGPKTGQEVDFVLADEFGTILDYTECDAHSARRDAFLRAGRTTRLSTISLEDFLTENKAPFDIDYLSIDTEGSEFDILESFPFDRWCIRLISVEHNFTPMREKILRLLEPYGYVRTEAQWDDWYELSTSDVQQSPDPT